MKKYTNDSIKQIKLWEVKLGQIKRFLFLIQKKLKARIFENTSIFQTKINTLFK